MNSLHHQCQTAGRRTSALFLSVLLAAVAGFSSARAGDVTREVNDGSKAVRSISLTSGKAVILRNILPGQPLRYSYLLNFPLADVSKVTGILEKFLQVSDGTNDGDNLSTDFGSIGKTPVVLVQTGDRGETSYVLRVSEPPRSITAADARQFLKCIQLLPEMERDSQIAAVNVK